jgi:hypothetical protein
VKIKLYFVLCIKYIWRANDELCGVERMIEVLSADRVGLGAVRIDQENYQACL